MLKPTFISFLSDVRRQEKTFSFFFWRILPQRLCLLLGGRFDGTLAWAGSASGDIYHHDLEQNSYYHGQLLDHGDHDHEGHDHEGGDPGAPGGDHQGSFNGEQMSGWQEISQIQCFVWFLPRTSSLFDKHRKNSEYLSKCPVSLLIVRSQRLS